MKSLVDTYVSLLSEVLTDVSTICHTSMTRDLMTIKSRVEHEGLSFLTITLPSFARAFEQCLELQRMDSNLFPNFKKSGNRRLNPAFLQGLTSLVFNQDGSMQVAPNPDAVEGIRQICLTFNKIKAKCTVSREKAAEEQFIATDGEVSRFRIKNFALISTFRYVCGVLYGRIFRNLSDEISSNSIIPYHGPGSTVDRTLGNKKYEDRRYTDRLHRSFPFDWYKLFSFEELSDNLIGSNQLDILQLIHRKDEPPVRVVFVPKTMKTPRVIAIEPVWTQHIQQGLMRRIVKLVETDSVLSGKINFSNQSINRNLAFESSLSKSNATIDLSEASDRIHPALVANMIGYNMILNRAVFSCRSERAKLPSGKVISLSKFASQGSALCFPVEAMVFYGIIVSALIKHRHLRLTSESVKTVSKDVFVYGDDIIVPNTEVDVASNALEAAGLKVNRKKSFSNGFFRESCGMDAFMGVNVTPVYVRHPVPRSKREATEIVSAVSTSNLFYQKGYWNTASFLRNSVEKILGVIPHVASDSGVLGWFSYLGSRTVTKWSHDVQRFVVKGYSPEMAKRLDILDGYPAMTKWATMRTGKFDILGIPNPLDASSFTHRAVRGKLRLRYRWSPA